MRSVTIALAAGLALTCVAVGLVLLRSPMSLAGANNLKDAGGTFLTSTTHGASYCQAHETLPRDTSAIRLWLDAAAGPRLRVAVLHAGHRVTGGERGSDWIGGSVTVPVKPQPATVRDVTVCASFRLHDETVIVQGNQTSAALATRSDGKALPGKLWIQYLRPGGRSWASLAPTVMHNMTLGRAGGGTWVVYFALALLLAVAAIASGSVFRELR
jgi:hypothetical protein